jgi:hypothetical protein
MTVLNYAIRGSSTLGQIVAAIEGEEAYGEQLTRLGIGAGTQNNWADFEFVAALPERLAADLAPTDAALAQAIQQRGAAWRLILVTTVFVNDERERIALFRRQP